MKKSIQQLYTGERALFQARDLHLSYATFADGESPLKESRNLDITHSLFKWKYPLWYANHIHLSHSTLFVNARAGIWYANDISMEKCTIEAPKTFRRVKRLTLSDVSMPNADETLWQCEDVSLRQVTAKGDYFAMGSQNLEIDGFELVGNYSFDGCKNVTVRNARMLSKDAFWNCENVTVHDSFISGEYLGWNAKNLTFVNCTIESLQGLCYIENLVMKNCKLLNTTLAFEYSTVDVQIDTVVDSVLNPAGGRIVAAGIGELILDPEKIDPTKTTIVAANLDEDCEDPAVEGDMSHAV